jgi:hypothetical protein
MKKHFAHMQPNGQQNLSGEKSSLGHISRSTRKTWSLPLAEPTKHTNGLGKQSAVPLPVLRLPPTCEEAARLHELSVQHRHGDPAAHHDAARRHRDAAPENRADAERKRREAENE